MLATIPVVCLGSGLKSSLIIRQNWTAASDQHFTGETFVEKTVPRTAF
ncbi:hypothetical protein [Mangrovicoccus ximenensis]